jgi:hypothetical protein
MILDAIRYSLYTVALKLATCLRNWPDIIYKLAEPPRRRLLQMALLTQALSRPG